MICERCRKAYMDFYGIECRSGFDPYYDVDQEEEGCIGFARIVNMEEIQEIRAEQEIAERRDDGCL